MIGGQGNWEVNSLKIILPDYSWFGKPKENIKGKRGKGEAGFS